MTRGAPTLEHFGFPAGVPSPSAAERAKVRLEQVQRDQVVARGSTDSVRLVPGRSLRVDGASDSAFNRRYVVRRVVHEYRRATPHDPGMTYANRVAMVPADTPARPRVPERRVRIEGMEIAATTGPRGEEIHVDDLGRVKLRFFWDRSGITDDRSSAWVRTLQMPLGAAMLLPRVGWEVPVARSSGDERDPHG